MLIKQVENIVQELTKQISIQGKFGYNSFVYGFNTNKLNQVKYIINANKMINLGLIKNYNSGFPLVKYQYPITNGVQAGYTVLRTEQIIKKLNDVFKIKYSDLITAPDTSTSTKVSYIYKDAIFNDTNFISTNIINDLNLKNTINV